MFPLPRSVHFDPPPNLSELLRRSNPNELEDFCVTMCKQSGPSLAAWMNTLIENVASLKPKLERFVLSVLSVPWTAQAPEVAAVFRHFLADLITAHGYYVRPVMLMLVRNLCYRGGAREERFPD